LKYGSLMAVFIFMTSMSKLHSTDFRVPHIVLGGGYFDGGRHSGGLFQLEYRFARYYCNVLRPQIIAIVPQLKSVFLGAGLGFEIKIDKFLVIPSFSPGLYFKGKGKDLGFPVEFRSSIEASYEWNQIRFGIQFYHISNASLSDKNPGANALVAVLSLPLGF
jgi:lipid A 3-O-deacylase